MMMFVFLNVDIEKHGDEAERESSVEELQRLLQHFLGKYHLAHVKTDLQERRESSDSGLSWCVPIIQPFGILIRRR